MDSEEGIHGELGGDDISAGTADAAGFGGLAAEQVDAARVWGETRNPTEHADVVAADLPACRRSGGERRGGGEAGGVHRSATAGEHSKDSSSAGDRSAQRASG